MPFCKTLMGNGLTSVFFLEKQRASKSCLMRANTFVTATWTSIFQHYDLVSLCAHIKHIALGTPKAIAKLKIFHFSGKIHSAFFVCLFKVPDLCACLDDFTIEWHVLTQQKLVSATATTEFWAPTRRRRIRRCLFPFELPWRSGRLSTNMLRRSI